MMRWNLSEWGLRNQGLTLFALVASVVMGTLSYFRLGRAEDPSFTIKTMVVTAVWPGASAADVATQLTDPLERALQDVPYFDFVSSFSRPGTTALQISLKDETPPAKVQELWYTVRKKVGDIRGTLPAGVIGPFFNDDFGDTFGTIYVLEHDGIAPKAQRDALLAIRQRFLRVPGVGKVDLLGLQPERIYVELPPQRLAQTGITLPVIAATLQEQTGTAASGALDVGSERLIVRTDRRDATAAAIAATPLQAPSGRTVRLGDLATVTRGPVDPPESSLRHRGHAVVGLAISMAPGGNITALGEALDREATAIASVLPAGVRLVRVANQAGVVKAAVGEFTTSLIEALAIVLGVSFLTLGWRSGLIVAFAVPITLAMTFLFMDWKGIDLHRISLGALIISLGLLVDDAIITVEMMLVKLEEGWDRFRAASFAWTSTAFPMLSGTIVTAAGFIPVGLAASASAEYTNAIFWVVGGSLMLSWLVAVLFTPFLGYHFLPRPRPPADGSSAHSHDGRWYGRLRALIASCVAHRRLVTVAAVSMLALTIGAFPLVQQQFFPTASRPEVIVDVELREGSTYATTQATVARVERVLAHDSLVRDYTAFVGTGAPRFYLSLNPELPNPNVAQFVVITADKDASIALFARLRDQLAMLLPEARVRVSRLEHGPPVGYPVQFRVLGPDPEVVRTIAAQVRDAVRTNPHLRDVHLDWSDRSKAVRLAMDPDRVRQLGVSQANVQQAIDMALSGLPVAQVPDGNDVIPVVLRAPAPYRTDLHSILTVPVPTSTGQVVPVGQVATPELRFEDGVIWRRSRDAVITVRADIADDTQAPVISTALTPALDRLRQTLPAGYRIDVGGAAESSASGQSSILAGVPLMLLVMLTTLMLQLRHFSRVMLVVATAPFGLVGAVGALLLFNAPFGFVAQLGVIALAGIIMRNAVILVDQIEQDRAHGATAHHAIVEATVRRTRPILLTAAAAILAMIPLTRSTFWGPMAIAIMGGLTVATLLTILVVPAVYAWAFDASDVEPDHATRSASAPVAPTLALDS